MIEKSWILCSFLEAKTKNIEKNGDEKHAAFLFRFLAFVCDFFDSGSIGEAPGFPKIYKNRSKRPKHGVWGVSWSHLFSKVGFGRALEGFWEGFWQDFGGDFATTF